MKKYYSILVGILFCVGGSSVSASANMQEQDALRLWRLHSQQFAQQRQEQNIDSEQPTNEITLEGESFQVENNVEFVGQALYIALNRQLWRYAEQFLAQYEKFPDHKVQLAWFAKGALAREQGDLPEAERYYRKLLQSEPDFLRGQLDLARVLFEDKKNTESTALFRQLSHQPLPDGVLLTIQDYQQALKERENWNSSLTLGYLYHKNLNQSSQRQLCLLEKEGQCFINRRSPDAINTYGWRYDFTAQRRISLQNHHGLEFYFNGYGQFYPRHHDYDENTVKLYGGYSFRNAKTEITAAPILEYSTFGDHRYYHGWGAHLEWTQNISPRHSWNTQFEYKKLRYSKHYSAFDKTDVSTLFGTWYYLLTPQTTLFAGADLSYRHTPDDTQSYRMLGARLGLNYQFDFGLNATVLALWRNYNYQVYHAALELKRKDRQQIYLAILKIPSWNFKDITPYLLLKHTRNKSNADYVYSYKQSEIQLNFEWRF
ncbi:surface lipoprotein assembly modifier [Rodentibacter pneumotropicus]|uniref:surface lipoprotein assembly modifier n=1 Tax=Rodentibacter pneumotropicus TaxID=758 RepID=UPI002330168F|nr:surface lipoprotein assembly modifier [Rodentibacter pneumotropicus]MDC2826556.1 surface lipoprotein assembly modifier [Rodentibacter pneumotropicus]